MLRLAVESSQILNHSHASHFLCIFQSKLRHNRLTEKIILTVDKNRRRRATGMLRNEYSLLSTRWFKKILFPVQTRFSIRQYYQKTWLAKNSFIFLWSHYDSESQPPWFWRYLPEAIATLVFLHLKLYMILQNTLNYLHDFRKLIQNCSRTEIYLWPWYLLSFFHEIYTISRGFSLFFAKF